MANNHYINNKKFETLVIEFSNGNKKNENELFEMFDLLITNVLLGFRFRIDLDDAKQECFLLILKVLPNFNSDSGTAFNYFTTVIVNNLRLVYSKNKRYAEKIAKYTEHITGHIPSSL